jgi:hypothetical protein
MTDDGYATLPTKKTPAKKPASVSTSAKTGETRDPSRRGPKPASLKQAARKGKATPPEGIESDHRFKVLICTFKILNYGGIVTYTEDLKLGMDELGHRCDLIILGGTDRDPYYKQFTIRDGSWSSRFEGFQANPDVGWGGVTVYSYANKARIKEFFELASKYDLLIWNLPVPSYSSLNETPNWKMLYRSGVSQVGIIHDGNFRYLYPHLNLVSDRMDGVLCVHGAAYGSAKQLNGKYSLIPNAHEYLPLDTPWEERKPRILSAHVWKGWKHMENAVAASPHLKNSVLILGGDGIERRYMTSPDKCPDKYKGLWSAMEEAGTSKWIGLVPPSKLKSLYQKSRVMFDPSYSVNYNSMGSHFNRSVFEALNCGCIPVCMEANMQLPGIFEDGRTHIGIPTGASPRKIARILDDAANLDSKTANRIVKAGRSLIKNYMTPSIVANSIIDLSYGNPCGLYSKILIGKPSKEIQDAALNINDGGRPKSRLLD